MSITRLTSIETNEPAPSEGARRVLLIVYEGEHVIRTRVVELPEDVQLTVGRSRDAAVRIDSPRVSRIHARLGRRGDDIWIADEGSRNRTWVNGAAVKTRTPLASGDEIVVGPATIVVNVTSRVAARTVLGSSSFLDERLTAELDRGMRYRRPCGLAIIGIDAEPHEIDAAVDRMAERIRPMDVLAEYSPNEIAIILPELDLARTEAVARLLASEARGPDGRRSGGLEVRVGVAAFPDHGQHTGDLVARARAALRSARRHGGVGTPPDEPQVHAGDIVVADPQMRRIFDMVHKVAARSITVLVTGETGAGKEVIASAVHQASPRRDRPYLRLNCASIPDTLLESALFGHEQGAFTGADRRKLGYFEAADGGTLFLDEIGEVSPAMQAKLLRVLEQGTFNRVGGVAEIRVDVRVVCATNRDLAAEVAHGRFREDLYFRLSVFTILIPPLRDRPAEIPLLAEKFLAGAAREGRVAVPALSEPAREVLSRYSWPGNVRELRNAIERALVICNGQVIEVDDLPERVRETGPAVPPRTPRRLPTIDGPADRDKIAEAERQMITAALEACGGNQTRAAKKLGITRRALIYRMEKHGLKPKPGG